MTTLSAFIICTSLMVNYLNVTHYGGEEIHWFNYEKNTLVVEGAFTKPKVIDRMNECDERYMAATRKEIADDQRTKVVLERESLVRWFDYYEIERSV